MTDDAMPQTKSGQEFFAWLYGRRYETHIHYCHRAILAIEAEAAALSALAGLDVDALDAALDWFAVEDGLTVAAIREAGSISNAKRAMFLDAYSRATGTEGLSHDR